MHNRRKIINSFVAIGYVRSYTYEFIQRFAPDLKLGDIERVLKLEAA
jgi:hypothetical protein